MPEIIRQTIPHQETDISPVGKQLRLRLYRLMARLEGQHENDKVFKRVPFRQRNSDTLKRFPVIDGEECSRAFFVMNRQDGIMTSKAFVGREAGLFPRTRSVTYYVGRMAVPAGGVGLEQRGATYSREDFTVRIDKQRTEIASREMHHRHPGSPNPLVPPQPSALSAADQDVLAAISEKDFGGAEPLADPHGRLITSLNVISVMLAAARSF